MPRCTRLLFHHQCHLKSNQTRHQCTLEYNALCVPAQHAHLFTVGLSSSTPSRIKLVRPRSTHSLRSGVHDAVHSKNRRRVHQEPLGHNTRLVHHCIMRVCADATRTRQRHDGVSLGITPLPPSPSLPSPLLPKPPTHHHHALNFLHWRCAGTWTMHVSRTKNMRHAVTT